MESDGSLDAEVVAGELKDVAERLVPRAFGVPVRYPKKELKRLTIVQLESIVARGFPDEWQEDEVHALELTLGTAIRQLEGRFAANSTWKPSRPVTNEEVAFRYFNLNGAPSLPDVKAIDVNDTEYEDAGAKGYSKVRAALKAAIGFQGGDSTLKTYLDTLRRSLAAILLKPGFPFFETSEQASASGTLVVRSTLADMYVPRPEYEQQIRQRRDAGERHVWLWGDAGTGKTRLARAANRDVVVERAVLVLPCGGKDKQTLQTRMSTLLIEREVSGAEINPQTLWGLFYKQLTNGTLPKVIVFDDLGDAEQIRHLTEVAHTSFLIFTSIGAPPANYHGPKVEIRGMTETESERMIRSRLPKGNDRDVAQLHEVLGGRPLAIEHSCAFLRETGMSIREYCRALVKDPATVLDAPGEEHTLTKIYPMVLEQLAPLSGRLRLSDVLRLLDLLVFSTDLMTIPLLAEVWADGLELPVAMPDFASEIDDDYVRSASLWCGAWPGVRFIDPTRLPAIDPLKSVTLGQALERLQAFALVRSDNGRLVMHQLTRAILRALRDEQADNIYQRIRQTVYDTVRAENWQGGDALSATRLWWAPQLREALTRALRTVPGPADISTEEAIRLATLAAVMMHALRQLGLDPTIALNDVARAAVVASFRHQAIADDDPGKEALWAAYRGLHAELLEFLILSGGFDRGMDSFPSFNEKPSPLQKWLANTVRLKYSTEWDLAHHYAPLGEREAHEHHAGQRRQAATSDQAHLGDVRASASAAVEIATIYYDQARWDAAIDALEHAYSCYLQIGASVEAIRGAMDAGRRLSRVHLRAGHLDEAGAWLDRVVREVYQPRCESFFNGRPSPFKLVDRLLWVQVEQARVELELTKSVLEWDRSDDELLPEAVASVVGPWHERAKRAVERVRELRATRLIPEFSMHAFRLQVLAGRVEGTEELSRWFDPEKEPYRATLLRLQAAVFLTPFMIPILAVTDEEFRSQSQAMSPAEAEHAVRIRNARDQMGVELVELAQEIGVTHGNPYWHARGICAAAMLATVAGADPAWAASLRDTAKQGARNIGRPDWAEKIDRFGDTNTGIWLIGY